jgi:hypothetical protein
MMVVARVRGATFLRSTRGKMTDDGEPIIATLARIAWFQNQIAAPATLMK